MYCLNQQINTDKYSIGSWRDTAAAVKKIHTLVVRHDLFLCFGLWHADNYAHVALWHEFRATFLADVFWAIFPNQKLLRRPTCAKRNFLHLDPTGLSSLLSSSHCTHQ